MIETERLIIRRAEVNDAPFLLELFNDPEWIEFLGDKGITTLAEAKNHIENKLFNEYKKWGFGFFIVKLKKSMNSVGMCGLRKVDYLDHVDIGFGLLSEHKGKGYATEYVSALLDHGKNTFGLNQIVSIAEERNNKSIKVIEKIGLRYERMIKIPGENLEFMLYS